MSSAIKTALGTLATTPLFSWSFRPLMKDQATIFMFHRFLDPDFGVEGHNPILLRRALAEFRRSGLRLVPLTQLIQCAKQGESVGGMVAFTVDDGYGDFYRVGHPMFDSMDCPVTAFLTTGFLDDPGWRWWDRLRYTMEQRTQGRLTLELERTRIDGSWEDPETCRFLRRRIVAALTLLTPEERDDTLCMVEDALEVEVPPMLPERFSPMGWDQVRELSAKGVAFGPHTVEHRSFGVISPEEARREVVESWKRVREESSTAVPVFCFPFGGSRDLPANPVKLLTEEGLDAAVTTIPGHIDSLRSPELRFRIPRFSWPMELSEIRQIVNGVERAKMLLPPRRPRDFSPERR